MRDWRGNVPVVICGLLLAVALPVMAVEEEVARKEPGAIESVVTGVASSFNIPEKEIWKYRALGAEVKAIMFESQKAIQKRNVKIQALLDAWKKRHGIKNLEAWRVDTKLNRIFRPNKSPREESDQN